MAVPFTNLEATFLNQFICVISIGTFVVIASLLVWFIAKTAMGIRLTEKQQSDGADLSEIGLNAYPEFSNQ